MGNKNLIKAKKAKNDEFYTQQKDIEAEIIHYKEHLKDKVILCNCDDPFESEFFRYFVIRMKSFGIKKVIGIAYEGSSILWSKIKPEDVVYLEEKKYWPYKAEFTPEMYEKYIEGCEDTVDGVKDALCNEVGSIEYLKDSGDFRDAECVEILKRADIVITNPPFSLFREYIAQLIEYNKEFIILGNLNAVTYKDIFKLIKTDKIWIGASIHSGDREFKVPNHYELTAAGHRLDGDGNKYIRVKGVRWFTNINLTQRHEDIIIYKKYMPEEYTKYDNYDAINVDKVSDIPCDYYGNIGVPITFLDKYNPEQFEIIGLGTSRDNFIPNKSYINPKKHTKDGKITSSGEVNCVLTIETTEKPNNAVYYTSDNSKYLISPYARVIIKRKINKNTVGSKGERMQLREERIKVRDIAAGYKDSDECGVVAYSGKLNVRPEYQREFVYSGEQRDAVIDTIRNGYPLNVMYWVENEDGTYECLDGQQRTISICQYVNDEYLIDNKGWVNLTQEEKDIILNYEIPVYFCKGSDSEKLAWFRTINKVGEKLNEQELRNAIYTGKWLADAKRYFSKSGCPAFELGKKYIKGTPIRQDFLETTIEWIADKEGLSIEGYMAKHQHDDNAEELWTYYQDVINWVTSRFTVYRKEMKGLPWGIMYNKYSCDKIVPSVVEAQIAELMIDKDVTKRSGIYMYVLSGEEKWLNIRQFDDADKRAIYEIQKGICPYCEKEGRASIEYDIDDMEVDHILPWSKGGKTEISNGQCLCKEHNRRKSNI